MALRGCFSEVRPPPLWEARSGVNMSRRADWRLSSMSGEASTIGRRPSPRRMPCKMASPPDDRMSPVVAGVNNRALRSRVNQQWQGCGWPRCLRRMQARTVGTWRPSAAEMPRSCCPAPWNNDHGPKPVQVAVSPPTSTISAKRQSGIRRICVSQLHAHLSEILPVVRQFDPRRQAAQSQRRRSHGPALAAIRVLYEGSR